MSAAICRRRPQLFSGPLSSADCLASYLASYLASRPYQLPLKVNFNLHLFVFDYIYLNVARLRWLRKQVAASDR